MGYAQVGEVLISQREQHAAAHETFSEGMAIHLEAGATDPTADLKVH
jgi:hypothetical protein